MKNLPEARTAGIVVQYLGEEILIYDLTINQVFCLNKTLSVVYQACDGITFFDELKRRFNFTDELIFLALDELKKYGLIEKSASICLPLTQPTRREIIKSIGLTAIAVPLIASVIAPTAAMAQSAAACVPAGVQATATASNTNGSGLLACLSLASQKCCNVPPFAFQSSGPNICDGFSCSCTYDCQ